MPSEPPAVTMPKYMLLLDSEVARPTAPRITAVPIPPMLNPASRPAVRIKVRGVVARVMRSRLKPTPRAARLTLLPEPSRSATAPARGFIWLGTIPLTSGLVGQMFGMRYLGALYGIVFLGHQLGSFLGVWLGGFVFDTTGSYSIIWWAAVALGIASSLIHLPINELRQTDLDLLQAGSIAKG